MAITRTPTARKSIRLKGYDYSEPGSYFVTICAARRTRPFGVVENGKMVFSPLGRIVSEDWKAIPDHFPNVGLDVFTIMPDHMHGILIIHQNLSSHLRARPREFGKPVAGSLSTILGAFKAGVTLKARRGDLIGDTPVWQSRFHDHVIRNDVELYFIRRYVELNLLIWEFDASNPRGRDVTVEELESLLADRFGIAGNEAYRVLGAAMSNRLRLK